MATTLKSLAVIVLLTVIPTWWQGTLTQRWQSSEDLQQAAARLDLVPEEFGDWRCQDSRELARSVQSLLQCRGYIDRTYVNQRTGAKVVVSVLVGPAGPMSVHDPQVCYAGLDLEPLQPADRFELKPDGKDSVAAPVPVFYRVTFRSQTLAADRFRVYYAWSKDFVWTAPDLPRIEFAGLKSLYKIQVGCHLPAWAESSPTDSCQDFLKDFVPLLLALPSEHDGR